MSRISPDRSLPFSDKKGKTHIPVVVLYPGKYRDWLKKQDSHTVSLLKDSSFSGNPGQSLLLRDKSGKTAKALTITSPPFRAATFSALAESLRGQLSADALKGFTFSLDTGKGLSARDINDACIGWGLAAYAFTAYKKDTRVAPRLLWPEKADRRYVLATLEAIGLVRDLINMPSNDMGPAELESAARHVAQEFDARFKNTADKALLKDNFPMIYAVGDGSVRRPRLLDFTWGNPRHPKLTLVGKGVCFDSGGLDIKPAAFMLTMKKDMGGAAHVLGLAWMIMSLKIPVRLRVLIPAVENSTSGSAYRPMDILQSRKGLTVEIGDTDAEGRLVLADALTLACEESPDLIINCATLTGAARVALGYDIPALFSNNESTSEDVRNISMAADDPVWPLPLWAPYRREMDSPVADISNTGSGKAGAIHAALFLKDFIDSRTEWIHLDMFAWEQTGKPGRPRGGADTGLRALFAYIEKRYGKKKKP